MRIKRKSTQYYKRFYCDILLFIFFKWVDRHMCCIYKMTSTVTGTNIFKQLETPMKKFDFAE